MKKITKLTEEQKARFPEFVEKWVKIGLSTEPADFEKATEAALKAYKLCNLEKPMVILRMGSPYAATVGGAYAWMLLRGLGKQLGKLNQKVGQEVGREVGREVGQKVRREVGQKVRREVGQKVRREVGQRVPRRKTPGADSCNINYAATPAPLHGCTTRSPPGAATRARHYAESGCLLSKRESALTRSPTGKAARRASFAMLTLSVPHSDE